MNKHIRVTIKTLYSKLRFNKYGQSYILLNNKYFWLRYNEVINLYTLTQLMKTKPNKLMTLELHYNTNSSAGLIYTRGINIYYE